MNDNNKVLDYIDRNYGHARKTCMSYCVKRGIPFSEDVYHDTIIKVTKIYDKRGLRDETDAGILSYIWKSFKTNIIREKQYKANQNAQFVDEMGGTTEDEESKLASELFNDFAINYIYRKIENEPDITADEYNCYRLKTICNKTYRQMQEKYDWTLKELKQSVTKVRRYIRNNISMKEIKREFHEQY